MALQPELIKLCEAEGGPHSSSSTLAGVQHRHTKISRKEKNAIIDCKEMNRVEDSISFLIEMYFEGDGI